MVKCLFIVFFSNSMTCTVTLRNLTLIDDFLALEAPILVELLVNKPLLNVM